MFFEIFVREFWELIKLNLLFLLTCIPIVTIGAAYTAMTRVTLEMVRDQPRCLWVSYRKAFVEYWKAGSFLGWLQVIVSVGAGFLLLAYQQVFVLMTCCVSALLLCTMGFLYVLPMLVGTDLSLKHVIHNAPLLAIVQLPHSLPTALLLLLFYFLEFGLFPLSVPFVVLFGFSVPCLIGSFAAWAGIEKHIIRT